MVMVKRLLSGLFGLMVDLDAKGYVPTSMSSRSLIPFLSNQLSNDKQSDSQKSRGVTALIITVWHNRTDIIKLLLKKNATIKVYNADKYAHLMWPSTIRTHNISKTIRLLLKDRKEFQGQNLSRAIADNKVKAVQALVREGAFVDVTD
jgi:ankyrin repeat protein